MMIVAILGMAALAIDVSNAYADLRFYRATADAASLAAAQDLNTGSRAAPGSTQYQTARQRAIQSLVTQLQATGLPAPVGACDPAINPITDCPLPGTPYVVSVKTPVTAAECQMCDRDHAVRVGIRDPNYRLTFSNVFGIRQWSVGLSSVSGLTYGANYAIVTLRPPNVGALPDVKNILLSGNFTVVNVDNGDVGTNANMTYNGTGAILTLDPGYRMDYYDPYNGPLWGNNPVGTKIPALIPDPNYTIPADTPPPAPSPFNNYIDGQFTTPECQAIVNASNLLTDPGPFGYAVHIPGGAATPDWSHIKCYRPGLYNDELVDFNDDLTVLTPGLYHFEQGIDVQSSLVGGYEAGVPGVALVIPQTELFKQRNGIVALNAGTKFGDRTSGVEALAAIDYSGNPVQTNTSPPVKMTVMVHKDPACTVTTAYPFSCDDTHNNTLDMSGNTDLYLAGVQYAPSDHSKLSGGSNGRGFAGQVITWTVTYTGGTSINQEGAGFLDGGLLRIDGACSGPGTPCG